MDDLTPQQIKDSPDPANLVEMASRPQTGGMRPITPSIRATTPNRLGTPGSRPSSGDARPLFYKSSSRAGS